MGVEDVGWNVIMLARRYGIEDRVLMSSLAKTIQGVSTAQLNRIYNACDVGINTSSAEGWGLPSFEHAATRAAQIVPRHTACAELWHDGAVMLEPAFKAPALARRFRAAFALRCHARYLTMPQR